jgi:putative DNA primase/helicase
MSTIVATYSYTDEHSVILYQTLRYEPKEFRQRRPDGQGGWVWDLQGVRRVLYRLPELLAAQADTPIFVTEGEKDADNLRAAGLTATTCPLGAGKWRPEYTETLRGRHVVILPDNDEAGRKHARQVADALCGIAASVRVLPLPDLPPKGDISDWLLEGGTVEESADELLALARRAELYTRPPSPVPIAHGGKVSVSDLIARHLGVEQHCHHDELLAMDLPPPSWLVQDLVADEGLTMLGGKKKLGKSWLCLQVAQAVALGAVCLGRNVVQGSVVYLCLEDGRRRLKSRLLKQQAPHGLPITYYTRFPPLDGNGLGMLLDLMAEHQPRLVIIDTLAAAKTGKTDENSSGPMADIGNALRALAQVYQAGVLATHHHGKLIGGNPGDDLRGSSALGAAGDVNLGLYREQGGYLIRGEGRDVGEFTIPIRFDKETTWAWQARDAVAARSAAMRDGGDRTIIEAVRELGPSSLETIAEHVRKSPRRTADRLRKLAADGVLTAQADGEDTGGRPRIIYSVDTAFQDTSESPS